MKPARRPTRIHDVAAHAGVSVATVSRAMSNPAIVSETTRKAVEKAIAETGYTLNMTARNLRQQQVGGVLALVPRLANPFFSEILSGIAEVLREKGLNLFVLDTSGPGLAGRQNAIAGHLTRSRADGIIVLDGTLDVDLFGRANAPPVVQACEWIDGLDAPRVLADNAEGARLAIGHLTGLGHRRILHLTGPSENSLTIARREGVLQGIAEAGLDPRTDLLTRSGDFSLASGDAAARALVADRQGVSAVFCDNDEMAVALLHGLTRGGVRVPQDISVVGFDNIEIAAYSLPALTTIRQRRARIGRHAARALVTLIEGGACEAQSILPVELVLRESTAAVNSA